LGDSSTIYTNDAPTADMFTISPSSISIVAGSSATIQVQLKAANGKIHHQSSSTDKGGWYSNLTGSITLAANQNVTITSL